MRKKKNTLARLALRALNCKAEWESNIGFDPGWIDDVEELSQLSYLFSMNCWARSGFQVIDVPPKLAAQYALTEFPGELPVNIKWPWQSFLVTCSDRTLGFSSVQVNTDMQAAGFPGGASLIIEPLDGTREQWVAHGPLSEMLKPGLGEQEADRVRMIAARIALSAALLLTDPAQLSQARKLSNPGHRRGIVKKKPQRGSLAPAVKRYVLSESVSVDLREIVGEYIRHGGGHPKVRTVVCGHHKLQAYGPMHSLRKHIWVKPYVRGVEFEDQVIRPHVIKSD